MKKILALLLSLILLTTYVSALTGDVNGDDKITVYDAMAALKIAAGLDSYNSALDVNADSKVDMFDALQLLRCALGLISVDGLPGDYSINVQLTPEAKAANITEQMLNRGIVNTGNPSRIARVMRKAQRGEKITIGYIGGSVTVGGAASTLETRYARVVYNWWLNTFPDADIDYVNAGVSGTPSLFGLYRCEDHLLRYKPDFIIIEFAVNDESQDWQAEAYASLVRKILTADFDPAVMLLFVTNDGGINAQGNQQPIGEYYNLPMVSYRDAIWPEVKPPHGTGNKFVWEDICADWVHPTDKGHAIVGQLVNCYLKAVYDSLDKLSLEDFEIPAPPRPYTYEDAKWYTSWNTTPISLGSFKTHTGNFDRPNGSDINYVSWQASGNASDPLVIKFFGKRVIIPIICAEAANIEASVIIDDGAPVMLDKQTLLIASGAYGYYQVFDSKKPEWHTIQISLLSGDMDIAGLFIA